MKKGSLFSYHFLLLCLSFIIEKRKGTLYMNLITFDLDGTLNRTDLYAVDAHAQARREFHYPPLDPAFLISTFGGRSCDYIKELLPGADDQAEKAYLSRVAELELVYMKKHSAPFDGVPEMLDKLHQAGCTLAICSNSSSRYIEAVLQAIGIRSQIDEIQPLCSGMTKVETLGLLLKRLNPTRAIMVGDRFFDLEAARKNRIPFIGCRFGYCEAEIKSADLVADTPEQVGKHVLSLLRVMKE